VTYLLAAYAVLLATVLGYLVIHALKLARLDRELADLAERAGSREPEREEARVGG
jgi:CcmD family protein